MPTLYFCPAVSSFCLLSSIFFPRLISVVADWMSTILPHIVWNLSANLGCRSETCCTQLTENTGHKKSLKIHHLCTIAQLCRVLCSQLRHISTIGKNLLNSNVSPTCHHNMVNFGRLTAEIRSGVWDTSRKFPRVSRLGSILHRGTLVVGVSQTLRR